jgi:predicted MFS family arabinose efflux permease
MSTGQQTDEFTQSERGVPDRWFILNLLLLNYFVLYSQRSVFTFIQTPLLKDLNLSESQLHSAAMAWQMAYSLSALFVAYLSDRFRRRTVLIAALALSTALLAGMGCAQGYYDFLILRILFAAAQAASVPAIAGVMADCFTPQYRSRAVAVYLLSAPFSIVVVGWAGGTLADVFGWRIMIFSFAGLGCVIVVVLCLLFREPQRSERTAAGLGESGGTLIATIRSVLNVRSFLLLGLAYVVVGNVWQQLNYFLPKHFEEHYGMKLGESGRMATLVTQIGAAIGILTGGFLADILARHRISGRFLVQIAGLLIGVPAVFVIATIDHPIVIQIALFVGGVGFWLYFSNLWTTTFEVVDPAARSTAVGLLNVASGVLGSWPYPVIGHYRDTGAITDLRSVFLIYAFVLCAAVAVLVLLVTCTLRRDFRTPPGS